MPSSVPEYKVETLCSGTGTVPEFWRGHFKKVCVYISAHQESFSGTVLGHKVWTQCFIQNCERALTTQSAEDNFNGFVVLPYVQGVSEKIGRILKQQKVKAAYKPLQTINSLFPRPKERDDSDRQKSGIVYKINCTHAV